MDEKELRRYSRIVVDGDEQAPSRAMLRGVGFEVVDLGVDVPPEWRGKVAIGSGGGETVRFLEETGARSLAKPIDISEVLSVVAGALAGGDVPAATSIPVAQ